MRVIVCGGRDYDDRMTIAGVLGVLHSDVTVVHGDARGADQIASEEAALWGLNVEPWPADWARYGKGAGPTRNQLMLAAGADLVIAFPGGRGTADMVTRARKAGCPVLRLCTGGAA